MKRFFMTILAALGICAGCSAQKGVKILEPKEFLAAAGADSTAVILDVRQPSEFSEGHLEGAVNLDWLDEPVFMEGMKKLDKERTYYVYCRSGRRSNAAATKMQGEGFKVFDMAGGILRYTELGLPVIK